MIPFASQRGGGADLATHLQNAADNEHVEIASVRGAVAKDLHGAFAEWEAIARCLTRCEKYLYSLSVNPWEQVNGKMSRSQYMDYIDRVEDALGLAGQPRAVVFHIKEGREHAHVVWSRIDAANEKAVQLSFDKQKLMMVTREFARDHGLTLPDGYHRDGQDKHKSHQATLYEMHQQRETGLTKAQRMEEITKAWKQSDNAQAFVNALSEKGYMLARGDRPYVVVDMYGHVAALARMIDDRSVRAKDVRAFLEKDFPNDELPSVDEAKAYAKEFRDQLKGEKVRFALDEKKGHLKRLQKDRRAKLEIEQDELRAKHRVARETLAGQQQSVRDDLAAKHEAQNKAVADKRAWYLENGKVSNFVRISGVAILRERWHRFLDERRHEKQASEKDELLYRQQIAAYNLEAEQFWPNHTLNRRFVALDKIEKREWASLDAAYVSAQMLALRKGHEHMPSLGLTLSPPGRGTNARPGWHHYRSQITKKVIAKDKALRNEEMQVKQGLHNLTGKYSSSVRASAHDKEPPKFEVAPEFNEEAAKGSTPRPQPAFARAAARQNARDEGADQGEGREDGRGVFKEAGKTISAFFDRAAKRAHLRDSFREAAADENGQEGAREEGEGAVDDLREHFDQASANEVNEHELSEEFDRVSGADEFYDTGEGDEDRHPDADYSREQTQRPPRERPEGGRDR